MTSHSNVPNSIPSETFGEGELPAAFEDCVALLTDATSFAVAIEMERSDLDPNEYSVLELFRQQTEWTATQLVEKLSLDPSHISRLVAHLVDRRLLRRRRSRTDRRVVHLALTEYGSEIIGDARARILAYQNSLLEDVDSKELDGFFSTVYKVFQKHTEINTTPHE
ncbi:MAG: MarR family winged helix-turn-helix transcriptional regulator [bacterium]|nr:MarR family winged helix-turn-helix transcriptional regulator [bacterium]